MKKEFIMNKSEIIKDLKLSPIYNMSQSSLENFHTSFLCWLGNTYPIAFKKLFNKFNNKRFDEGKKHSCETQVKHTLLKNENDEKNKSIRTDLEFKFNDNELIIIENKIKSFPNDEQLKIYSNVKEFDKGTTTFILLSLVKKMDLPGCWKYMSYLELANQMEKIFNKKFKYDKYDENYHKHLIQDYIFVIRKISKIFETLISKLEEKKYNFYKYDKDIEDKKYDINKYDLRDIFIKYRTSKLANYINTEIIKKNKKWKVKNEFFNKKGVISIEKEVCISNVKFYIQIEWNQYRYAIVYEKDNTKIEDIANELLAKKLWFFNTTNKKLCKYGTDFKYLYWKLDEHFVKKLEEVEYKQIINRINEDIDIFENNLTKIKKTIKSIVK